MALIFMDGFDHYAADDVKYDAIAGLSGVAPGYARLSTGQGALLNSLSSRLMKIIPNNQTIYAGFAQWVPDVPSLDTQYPFFYVSYQGTTHVKFCFVNAYALRIYNGNNTQIGSDIALNYIVGKWHYWEFKIKVDDAAGEVIVRQNENQLYSGTNLDTRNGSSALINEVNLKHIMNVGAYYDDYYIDNAQFHGDCRIRALLPDANGNQNNFAPVGQASNFQCVDEATNINNDTDYVSANTVGNRDLYSMAPAPTLASIKGIGINNAVRKDDAGNRTIKNNCRSGGNNYAETDPYTLITTYVVHQSCLELDPADSQPWTKAKIDAAEFGLEITA